MNDFDTLVQLIWMIFKWMLPIAVFVAALNWFYTGRRQRSVQKRLSRRARLTMAGRNARQKGLDFEVELERLFQAAPGWRVIQRTPAAGDFGADLIVEYRGLKIAVQAKNTKNPVDEKAVQQTLMGKEYYRCDAALLISVGGVTPEAAALARRLGVRVWAGADVERLRRGEASA